eukprot:GHVP01003171.1.p1 GENE.GHVP01003171.1~~GHVP01003171.1.p1  ORF type:complete len:150 (-),score=13.47 GHVP01003171.1:488-937(-)
MNLIPNIGLFCFGVQYVFPCVQTTKLLLIREKKEASYDDVLQWAVYWCILTFYKFVESIFLTKFIPYIPLYHEFIFLLFLWLVLPEVKGTCWLWYNLIAQPFEALDNVVIDKFEPILKYFTRPKQLAKSAVAEVEQYNENVAEINCKEN